MSLALGYTCSKWLLRLIKCLAVAAEFCCPHMAFVALYTPAVQTVSPNNVYTNYDKSMGYTFH